MKDIYCVILAGGAGERLWPLSSYVRPKQLIPFINGSSLLEQTVQRVQAVVKNKNHLMVMTHAELQEPIKKMVGKQATVFTEPVGRNTGSAILLSCLEIYDKNEDAVVVVMPSDHFIPEYEKFSSLLLAAAAFASCYDQLVLLGIKPTTPATGYGYVRYKTELMPGWACFPVQKFHEKPDKEQAQRYLEQGDMLWNSGIFVGRVKVFLDQFQLWAPELWSAVAAYRANQCAYDQVPSISIDHAVLEKSDKIVIFPAHFEWHDVGTLPTFLMLKAQHEKESTATKVINVDATNNMACAIKKVVAFVGVDNLCVVETDEALLVVAHDRVESVRDVSSILKTKESKDAGRSKSSLATEDSL
ncbi:MAG: mannose-1-phosphate guanylyltransferase [Candidatus Babeliales bacterium]|jgi:mannose-1-phosphate guanylyltransferase/mannose-6-phosphate isomerase